ncbi:MAG: hypothetical protein ACXW1M_04615 [Acidimicrobiia bacterium]
MADITMIDPRREAHERIGRRFEVRVLEPSPPTIATEPWFADDPVVVDGIPTDATVVTPVPSVGITWDALARSEPDLAEWCADRWLGAWRPLAAVTDAGRFEATRHAWHALAEHVVTPARHRANGKIGLRYTRAGFGTPFFGADEQVRVAGERLVLVRSGRAGVHPITTLGDAADIVGIEAGAPADLFTPTTELDVDAPLTIDPTAARLLGDWFGFACSVLEVLRAGAAPDDDPARVQLWPEHFDLAVDLGSESAGARGTFGASPGDADHPEPYLYVTPWATKPDHPVWNATAFRGASLPLSALAGTDRARALALAFFARMQAVLQDPTP